MSMTDNTPRDARILLSAGEQVVRQQLNILHAWSSGAHSQSIAPEVDPEPEVAIVGDSAKWSLLGDLSLHSWQIECRDAWFKAGNRGVIKVVTGAGKTVLACAIIEKLQNDVATALRVAIVVPTVVLQDQWYDRLTVAGNLPESAIGRLGGGYSDALDGPVRILVCVLNSAAVKLSRMAEKVDDPILLVVDECHRAGADQMSHIFKTRRAYSLGLSATPERDDHPDDDNEDAGPREDTPPSFDESILGKELGPIIFELNYRQALEAGILSRFTIHHYGLPMEPAERVRYEKLSRDISDLRRRLQGSMKGRPMNGGALVGWARRMASRGTSALSRQAAEYVSLIGQRKQLLYRAKARGDAVSRLVENALANDPSSRIILFHESITEVMRMFQILRTAGVQAVAEHSQLPDSLRRESINLFRTGAANVLVSARSLIEGFDVPAADVGIVVASSSSVRQRIQTLGRILRKKSGSASERSATLHVLYMADSTDEQIYSKVDWEKLTGTDLNRYFIWDPTQGGQMPIERKEPPRRPKPSEKEIDWSTVKPGDQYPGAYEGLDYTCDAQGNVRDAQKRLVTNGMDIPALVKETRGGYGPFRITPTRLAVLVVRQNGDESSIIFAGFLPEPFRIDTPTGQTPLPPQSLALGDPCPDPDGETLELRVQFRVNGPVLAKHRPDGEFFARTIRNAANRLCGEDAETIVRGLTVLGQKRGVKINKIKVDPRSGRVFCELAGERIFVHKLVAGLEFADAIVGGA